jgi:ribonuclease VapC
VSPFLVVADTSAIAAILLGEPERDQFVRVIERASRVLISAGSVIEIRMVLYGRRGDRMIVILNDFLRQPTIEIVPVDVAQAAMAHEAFIAYGRGNRHPANLNFGDLFSYALAKTRNLPLLYKGADFSETDLVNALNHAKDFP